MLFVRIKVTFPFKKIGDVFRKRSYCINKSQEGVIHKLRNSKGVGCTPLALQTGVALVKGRKGYSPTVESC